MSTVLVERVEPEVALVTLNRPESLNAMTMELVEDLHQVCDDLAADSACRAVVLTGAGRGFCSGHDLSDMHEPMTIPEGMKVQQAFAGLTMRVNSLPQPVIAAVNGPAAGGGLALALAADTRVCSESARFNAAFVRIGLSGCDVGVSYLLPRIVGPTAGFEMMLSGRLVEAEEAKRIGLVLEVVADGEVVAAALEMAHGILRNSPFGVAMTKQVMWANLDAPSLQAAIELENRTQILCSRTHDFPEALASFREKRPPRFEQR
jgi:enoyl-CoA hydratase/carnithine racemase